MPRPGRLKELRKPKDLKKTLNLLWKYLNKRKSTLILAFVMVIINICSSLGSVSYLQPIIDNFLQPVNADITITERFTGLFHGVITLGCIFSVGIVAAYLQSKLMINVTQKTILDIRRDLFNQVQVLSIKYHDTHSHGEMMSRFTNDVDTLNDALQNSLTSLFSSVITLAGILALMLYSNWILTLITLLSAPLMFFLAGTIMKKSSKYFVAQQKNLGLVNGYIEEIMTGQKVVKVFCYEDTAFKEFNKLNDDLCSASTTAQSYAGIMMPVMKNVNTLTYAIIATVGGILSVFGHMSVGSLIVFLQLCQQFGRPINEASSQYNSIITAIAGAERIFEVINEKADKVDSDDAYELIRNENHDFFWMKPSENPGSSFESVNGLIKLSNDECSRLNLIPVKGDVKFKNVVFGYSPDKTILKGISLFAKPGEKIAFVGSTGAGKTTIINLINRFYDINDGQIIIDGIPIKAIKKDSLRHSIAVVLQDTHLFTGTIRENIRYGRLDATDNEVENAAILASAHSFIKRLPHGYDTVIQGDGANLSQGQRQLLNIARAAVADVPILILDEATSSVDTRTELHIEHGLDRLMKGRTTFIIAHRLSTIRNSNAIMVMEHGEIIERGTHSELLEQKGRYYELNTGAVELD